MKNVIFYITHHLNEHDRIQLKNLSDIHNCKNSQNFLFVLLDTSRMTEEEIYGAHEFESIGADEGYTIIFLEDIFVSRELSYKGYVIEKYEGDNNPLFYGNCMLMIMYVYSLLKYCGVDYFWIIEHDVYLNGKWSEFLDFFDESRNEDFIPSIIHPYDPFWWHANQYNFKNHIDRNKFLVSFNPIMRLSNNAMEELDKSYREGNSGFYELYIPTYFNNKGMSIKSLETYGWTDIKNFTFIKNGSLGKEDITQENYLYHPVKNVNW